MNGLERTLYFLRGKAVDHPPFHPIIMRWAAKYAGVKYREFCTDPYTKCKAMILCAHDFDIDWVTVMSDPWAEASAFGVKVEYPEDNLPIDIGGHCPDAQTASSLKHYNPLENRRCMNRLIEIKEFNRQVGKEKFIVGWIEGPVAEYVDLNTESILPGMIKTEADIIDIDHLVPSLADFAPLLGAYQVFSGKSDPVTVIQAGPSELIRQSVISDFKEADGRCIVSAGCEITPETSVENMKNLRDSAVSLNNNLLNFQ